MCAPNCAHLASTRIGWANRGKGIVVGTARLVEVANLLDARERLPTRQPLSWRQPPLVPFCGLILLLGFIADRGNTRRRFRTRSKFSPVATEADHHRRNPCRSHLGPRGHRRAALANRALPCGGPGPYRVPSSDLYLSAPCCRCRWDELANPYRSDGPHYDGDLPHATGPIAEGYALAARAQSGAGWEFGAFPSSCANEGTRLEHSSNVVAMAKTRIASLLRL